MVSISTIFCYCMSEYVTVKFETKSEVELKMNKWGLGMISGPATTNRLMATTFLRIS